MAKDWNFYKKQYLEDQVSNAKQWFESIEKRIESPIERIAYLHLLRTAEDVLGFYELVIQPQVQIGKYRVDFQLRHWETDTWFVIECDGHDYHEKTKEQAAYDKKRDRFLIKQGYVVLRYTGSQICSNPDEIFSDVLEIITTHKKEKESAGG